MVFPTKNNSRGFIHTLITYTRNLMSGFTLIEAILYLAIASTILYFISGFAFNVIFGKAKIEAIHELNQNGQSVLNEISNTISDSVGINGFNQE